MTTGRINQVTQSLGRRVMHRGSPRVSIKTPLRETGLVRSQIRFPDGAGPRSKGRGPRSEERQTTNRINPRTGETTRAKSVWDR
jgi:hypothetical protein